MTNVDLLKIIGIIFTLLLVGFFAGIEVAFVSANKFSFELKRKQGLRSGKILSQLLEQPVKFIGTAIFGLTLTIVVYGLLVGEFLSPLWDWIEKHFTASFSAYIKYLRLIFETLLSTLIILIVQFSFRAFSGQRMILCYLFLRKWVSSIFLMDYFRLLHPFFLNPLNGY